MNMYCDFRAIKREFRAIEHLFTQKNFNDLPADQKPGELQINATLIQNFMSRMMKNYCVVFNIECNQR